MKTKEMKGMIEIPEAVWDSAETKEEIEDWLLVNNPKVLRQLRHVRTQEDLAGRGTTLSALARKWNIKL